MEQFKILVFEFLLGYCLQAFSMILGIFAFNRKKIILKSYIITSLLVILSSYLVRLLPISFGVHTLLNMLFIFLVCVTILKIPAYNTIRSVLLVTVVLLISEMVDVMIMIKIFGKEKFESMMLIPIKKALIGFPGVAFFTILMIITYIIVNNQEKKKGDSYGETSK